jgi:hypothetical protein
MSHQQLAQAFLRHSDATYAPHTLCQYPPHLTNFSHHLPYGFARSLCIYSDQHQREEAKQTHQITCDLSQSSSICLNELPGSLSLNEPPLHINPTSLEYLRLGAGLKQMKGASSRELSILEPEYCLVFDTLATSLPEQCGVVFRWIRSFFK